jgi:hypothetical protein
MASVTREEFVISSEFEVVHIPTGAVFQGDLTDVLQSVKVNWGRGGSPTGDYAERIWRMGSQLLLVRAHQVARDRLARP